MGQKLSLQSNNTHSLPLVWILKGQQKTHNPNPEQPIKFQYKTRRKSNSNNNTIKSAKLLLNNNLNLQHLQDTTLLNGSNKSEIEKLNKHQSALNRTASEPNLGAVSNKRTGKHRRKSSRKLNHLNSVISACNDNLTSADKCGNKTVDNLANYYGVIEQQKEVDNFGYDINDIDQFLAKASIEKPANIPVVLSFSTVLYQTRIGGYQEEITLPLGMVVNAIFRNQSWLYVQTPHSEEGYITYSACIPLGIIPSEDDAASPCWETSTDVFPRPSGNMTDTEKLSECGTSRCRVSRRHRSAMSTCGERSVDRLYLQAAASAKDKFVQRQTLLVISDDYTQESENTLSVLKGEVVTLLSSHVKGWFWVRRKDGDEGFIPSGAAGHGFL